MNTAVPNIYHKQFAHQALLASQNLVDERQLALSRLVLPSS